MDDTVPQVNYTTGERAMKYLALLLALFMSTAMAGDSGLYKDETRSGEGITMTRNGNTIQIFFFTYEPNDGCWNFYDEGLPDVVDWDDYDCHEQRWFLTGGNLLIGDTVTGYMYMTVGIDYPDGYVSPTDPFVSVVGEDFVVGLYVLKRQGDGWRMVVLPIGDDLSSDDPLYNTTYDFSKVILLTDEGPQINPQD
jgi:hypothetical protein